jgi:hypothetical protein
MSLPYPYVGLSPARLTDLINSDNSSSLVLGTDFTFAQPQAYSDSAGRNTKVKMVPVDPTKYAVTEIHYWRLPLTVLNEIPAGSTPVMIAQTPFSLHDILDQINGTLGLNLTPDEVIDQSFSAKQASYPIHINELVSLAWLDSDFQFQAQFPVPPVTNLFPNNSLPGFDPAP